MYHCLMVDVHAAVSADRAENSMFFHSSTRENFPSHAIPPTSSIGHPVATQELEGLGTSSGSEKVESSGSFASPFSIDVHPVLEPFRDRVQRKERQIRRLRVPRPTRHRSATTGARLTTLATGPGVGAKSPTRLVGTRLSLVSWCSERRN